MSQGDSTRSDEVMDHSAHDRPRRERGIEAARGYEEARRAILEGGIEALLDRAQIQPTDITAAMFDRYTEDALIRISTSSLTLMDDKNPAEFISDGFGRLCEHLKWGASERFGGLMAVIKLCGVRLPRPCPPQWLGKPRTSADRQNDEPEMVHEDEEPSQDGADTGSSVSSASTWMGGEVDASWRIPEKILALLPLQLCVTTSAEQAAEFLPSHGEGNPQTARHIRTPAELHKLSRTVDSAWRHVKFKTMHFDPVLARINSFSGVPDGEKEHIRAMYKNYMMAVEMASRQLNLIAAFVAQTELELSDGDDPESPDAEGTGPFSLSGRAPEAWALFEATIAAIAHPAQQLSVLLTNKIAAAYSLAGDPSIRLFVPDDTLKVAPPIDETDLVKKRQAEGELQAEMNPPKRTKSTPFSGRAASTTPGGGRRGRGGSSARGRGSVQRGRGGNRGRSRGGSRDGSHGGSHGGTRGPRTERAAAASGTSDGDGSASAPSADGSSGGRGRGGYRGGYRGSGGGDRGSGRGSGHGGGSSYQRY